MQSSVQPARPPWPTGFPVSEQQFVRDAGGLGGIAREGAMRNVLLLEQLNKEFPIAVPGRVEKHHGMIENAWLQGLAVEADDGLVLAGLNVDHLNRRRRFLRSQEEADPVVSEDEHARASHEDSMAA